MNAFKCSAIHKRVGYVLFGNETCASARLRGSYISAWLDTQPGFDSQVLFQPDVRYAANLSEKETAFLCVRIILGNFSAIVFQKVSSAGHRQVMRLCRKLGVRVVYDDCDPRLDFSHASLVDKVTVASPALAQELYSSFSVCSEVIEDTIDFSPPIKVQFDPANSWRGVWIGTSDKFDYFRAYRDKMHTVAPELVVTAISDHAEADIEWGLELFPTIFSKFGFGLVTLEDTEWSRTKSPNRATLMMANGLPVICENHLAYANVIDHGKSGFLATTPEEAATFAGALADADRWNLIASVGAKSVSERYGLDTIGPLWAAVILDNLT